MTAYHNTHNAWLDKVSLSTAVSVFVLALILEFSVQSMLVGAVITVPLFLLYRLYGGTTAFQCAIGVAYVASGAHLIH